VNAEMTINKTTQNYPVLWSRSYFIFTTP